MLGTSLPPLFRYPLAAAMDVAADPLEALIKVQEKFADWKVGHQPLCQSESNPNWETLLHRHLGADWPCDATAEFWEVWENVLEDLQRAGIRPGPASFNAYNDGDAGLTRAIWCALRSEVVWRIGRKCRRAPSHRHPARFGAPGRHG